MSVFSTSNKEFNDLHLRSLLASAKTPQELQPAKTPFFALEFNTSHPRVYQAPDGGYYINQFLHPNPPPFYQFSKEIQDQAIYKELEGEVLLVLEEMSNSKSGDWIAFANRFKDFIDNKDDRRYFIPDVSDKYVENGKGLDLNLTNGSPEALD
ncbi:12331_t:CDS:2 [Entrophospora sp. SA101]|nr:11738_t:CDS:2 [Entrophospora sp. SA101]CAJ0746104.1 12331_t:CDS:2 [Entrophospora sp. SA101]